MRSNESGGAAPRMCSENQASRFGWSIASSAMATNPMRGEPDHNGLLVDFGGVLTTSVWDSFAAFCRDKGLTEDSVLRLFREDPAALADLRQLETGRIQEDEFERRFAERLGLDDATDL